MRCEACGAVMMLVPANAVSIERPYGYCPICGNAEYVPAAVTAVSD